MNELKIIEEFAKGNQKVVAEVYKKYRNEFLFFVYKNYKQVSSDTARDIYQDAFCAFHKNIIIGKYQKRDNVSIKAYLFQIGKYQILNILKKGENIVGMDGIQITEEIEDSSPVDIESKENIVRLAIQKLTEECAKILTQVYWNRAKYEDIFESLGYTSVDSLKTQKYKCFKKLETVVKRDLQTAQLI